MDTHFSSNLPCFLYHHILNDSLITWRHCFNSGHSMDYDGFAPITTTLSMFLIYLRIEKRAKGKSLSFSYRLIPVPTPIPK